MGLTWRDLVSAVIALAIFVTYAGFQLGANPALLSSASACSAATLALGACCAVVAAGDLHLRVQPRAGVIFRRITTVLGAMALVAGLAGWIGDSGHALEILVVMTVLLWAVATLWHVLTIGSDQ